MSDPSESPRSHEQVRQLQETLMNAHLVISDFGGVLYDIDFALTRQAMCNLQGYNGTPVHFGVDVQDELFVAYDRDDISTPDFRQALREKFGFTADNPAIDAAWCGLLKSPFDFAPGAVRAMCAYAPTVLFSNISELHAAKCLPECRHFISEFEALYFSYRIHQRKPDPAAFEYICEHVGVEVSKTVLLDDSASNCDAAASIGMKVVRITDTSLLRQLAALRLTRER